MPFLRISWIKETNLALMKVILRTARAGPVSRTS